MNKKKLTIISVVLVMALAIGGVLAYLTSTAQVTNTFTVGDVDITLDEAITDDEGKAVDPDDPEQRTEEGNEYHLIPGQEYDKDPTVTVKEGSEESYVRMILTVHNASAVQAIIGNDVHKLNDYADLFAGWDTEKWLYKGFEEDTVANTISFEFRYFETVDASDAEEDVKLPALFTQLVIPGTLNNDELNALYGEDGVDPENAENPNDVKIVVEGHAIQAAGFEADAEKDMTAEDAAWAAFDQQMADNPHK